MERKTPFEEGEYYHVYTRGVEKRVVFQNESDKERFLGLLLIANQKKSVRTADLLKSSRGEPPRMRQVFRLKPESPTETLTDILAYAMMPNHIHLVVRERGAGGISKFMLKLMTAYSMYFNKKYERSGPLFTRPFRSKHIGSDDYLRWVFAYVHLNPLELLQKDWKERGVANPSAATAFMHGYRYASFRDYFGDARPESCILERTALPFDTSLMKGVDELLAQLSKNTGIPFSATESLPTLV